MTATDLSQAPLVKVTTETLDQRRVVVARTSFPGDECELTEELGRQLTDGIRLATEKRMPFIMVISTTGVAVAGGIAGSISWAKAAAELTSASGVIPTFAVAAGPVLSGPALLLGLVDVVVFCEGAYCYLSGPKNVETYTGVSLSADELGGTGVHSQTSGLASLAANDIDHALELVSDVLGYMPDNNEGLPPTWPSADPVQRSTDGVGELLPATPTGSYDVRDVISELVDDGEFIELRSRWAPNLVTGFASLGGMSVGVVANQPRSLAGSIDIPASQKGARFVAMCDAFAIPLLTLVDTSGFLPGKDLEWRGMIRHGAQMAFAYARATVPRVGLILRKSYGGAYIVMDSVNMGNDIMFAWPSAEVAVMGAKGAVEILHRKADDDERARLVEEYEAQYLTPYPAAERQSISAVIEPADSRRQLIAAFTMLSTKRERLRSRKHDNTPL